MTNEVSELPMRLGVNTPSTTAEVGTERSVCCNAVTVTVRCGVGSPASVSDRRNRWSARRGRIAPVMEVVTAAQHWNRLELRTGSDMLAR
ncbi:hypothetical protein JMUB6875_73040 [Nocardia sp. JMUB6875]